MAIRPGGARYFEAEVAGRTGAEPIAGIRSFVAVLVPADVRAALAPEIERLSAQARGVGWVAPENLHLTLKFLGGVEPTRLERVSAALQTAARDTSPFEMALRGLGAFPSPTRPRVIWAGVHAGGDELGALAARVDAALSGLDFPREDRPFSAHVTLGRVREPSRDPTLTAALAAGATRDFGRFPVAQMALMRSDLSPRGARYTALATWALGRSGPD